MFGLGPATKVYLALGATDMRAFIMSFIVYSMHVWVSMRWSGARMAIRTAMATFASGAS